jgi:hypothetical protein
MSKFQIMKDVSGLFHQMKRGTVIFRTDKMRQDKGGGYLSGA